MKRWRGWWEFSFKFEDICCSSSNTNNNRLGSCSNNSQVSIIQTILNHRCSEWQNWILTSARKTNLGRSSDGLRMKYHRVLLIMHLLYVFYCYCNLFFLFLINKRKELYRHNLILFIYNRCILYLYIFCVQKSPSIWRGKEKNFHNYSVWILYVYITMRWCSPWMTSSRRARPICASERVSWFIATSDCSEIPYAWSAWSREE